MPQHRFQPGHPRYGGRKPGTPNKKTVDARIFIETIIDGDVYQENFRKRLEEGKLAPQLEVMAWQYAKGKVTENLHLEATIATVGPDPATTSQADLVEAFRLEHAKLGELLAEFGGESPDESSD